MPSTVAVRRRRRRFVGALGASSLAVLMAWTPATWGCYPQPLLVPAPDASGPPGTRITVHGLNFRGPAEVRWNALDGELLATSNESEFSVEVTIPKTPAGLYTLLGISRAEDGSITGGNAAAFEVTSEGGQRNARPTTAGPDIASSDRDSDTAVLTSRSSNGPGLLVLAGGSALLVSLGGLAGLRLAQSRRRRPAGITDTDHEVP